MAISESQVKCEERGELEQSSVSCWTLMSEDELLRKFFAVLSTVVCVASSSLLPAALEDAWVGFCFTVQFSGLSLNAPVDVSEPVELPVAGLGPFNRGEGDV